MFRNSNGRNLLILLRYLRNVSIQQSDGKPDIAFSSDGTLKSVELKIMNLRPDGRSNQPNQEQNLIWEEVSTTNLISHKKIS